MRPVYISEHVVTETLTYLKEAGKRRAECVVLWLAQDNDNGLVVQRVYRPAQMARADIFRIPPASMQAVMSLLGTENLMIAAQVHSHPFEAFHSLADDKWAIVRHVNALSLVVPYFALQTDFSTFFNDTKTFKLSPANKWTELAEHEVGQWLKLS